MRNGSAPPIIEWSSQPARGDGVVMGSGSSPGSLHGIVVSRPRVPGPRNKRNNTRDGNYFVYFVSSYSVPGRTPPSGPPYSPPDRSATCPIAVAPALSQTSSPTADASTRFDLRRGPGPIRSG